MEDPFAAFAEKKFHPVAAPGVLIRAS